MDVIALLFDYVFRDPSIPERQRRLFGRLQVPIVKAALLDRAFFSDRRPSGARAARPSRRRRRSARPPTTRYGDAFEAAATRVVDDVCRDFEIDVAVFDARRRRARRLRRHASGSEAAPAFNDDVAAALAAEESEADRAQVRALRARPARRPRPAVRGAHVRRDGLGRLPHRRCASARAPESDASRRRAATLDDLLWSIVAKERTAQKARLTKMIPALVGGLRKRLCALERAGGPFATPFFEALYGAAHGGDQARPRAAPGRRTHAPRLAPPTSRRSPRSPAHGGHRCRPPTSTTS